MQYSRRNILGGMGAGLTQLLFSRYINAEGFFSAPVPASEAGAANGSLTLVAFSDKILRVRVVPLSKLGPPLRSALSTSAIALVARVGIPLGLQLLCVEIFLRPQVDWEMGSSLRTLIRLKLLRGRGFCPC